MRYYGTTGRDALGGCSDGVNYYYNPERVSVLKLLVKHRLNNPSGADPIRVFVKHEPHSMVKLEEGRLRLISAVSLVDTVCDRIMFGGLVEQILGSVGQTPVMIGWAPISGGSRFISRKFGKLKTRPIDMRAWDWTVDEKMVLAMKKVIMDLFVGAPEWVLEWIELRWAALFRDAVFQFGDGTQVSQPGWGLMKSGCLLTIILNSIGQDLRHFAVLKRMGLFHLYLLRVIMGDDMTLEDFERFEEYRLETLALGYLMKETPVCSGTVEFCGFYYRDGISWPQYVDKHLYVVLNSPHDKLPEILRSYQLLHVHQSGLFNWITELLASFDPSLSLSREWLRRIYDGL